MDDLLKMDGYDDCILGVCRRIGQELIVAYDYEKLIERHMQDGMSQEEAEEFIEYNQAGAYVGEKTPCFIEKM